MKKFRHIFFIALLIVVLSFSFVLAADKSEYFAADELYVMGLVKGSGNDQYGNPNYDLDNTLTRDQAFTIVVRLLGKEEYAQSKEWETPFTDLADWSKAYVGYAYNAGLTNGISDTQFGSANKITDVEYYTLLLRALGYKSGEDFSWDQSDKLAGELGFGSGRIKNLTRGKVFAMTVKAVDTKLKGQSRTLLDSLDQVTDKQLWDRKVAKEASKNVAKAKKMYSAAKDLKVSEYKLPKELGGQTLYYKEAYDLVGRAPVIVQNRVKTFADVIQYSIAAGFGDVDSDAFTPWYSNSQESWGFDWSGDVQLAENFYTCCAGATNYVNYLLMGDYDEQGWIQYLAHGTRGNHHFSWAKVGNKYYVIDLTQYVNRGRYNTYDKSTKVVPIADSLQDFVDNKWPSYYASKSEITHIYYAEEDGIAHPGNFNTQALIFPKDLEGHMGMLYVKSGEKSKFTFRNPTAKIYGYNTYEYVAPQNIKYVIERLKTGTTFMIQK